MLHAVKLSKPSNQNLILGLYELRKEIYLILRQILSGELRNGTGIFQRELQPPLAALTLTNGMA